MFSQLTDRQKGLGAALATAGTWSLLAILLKFALHYADSYTIVCYRMAVAFLTLLLWFLFKGKTKELGVFKTRPGLLLIASLCLAANYVGFMQGIHYTSPANAQIFIQIGPLFLALSGLYFFKESLSRKQWMGLSLCLVGFGLFFLDRMDKFHSDSSRFFIGLAWIVMAALLWAVFASLQKYLLTWWKSSQINIYIYLVATLVYLPLLDWQSLMELPWSIHLLYIFLGLNTIVAYGFLAIALKYLPATQVSPILTTNPLLTLVFITIIDAMNWGFIPRDPIGLKGYLGAIIAILGVRFVILKKKKLKV